MNRRHSMLKASNRKSAYLGRGLRDREYSFANVRPFSTRTSSPNFFIDGLREHRQAQQCAILPWSTVSQPTVSCTLRFAQRKPYDSLVQTHGSETLKHLNDSFIRRLHSRSKNLSIHSFRGRLSTSLRGCLGKVFIKTFPYIVFPILWAAARHICPHNGVSDDLLHRRGHP